MSYKIHPSAPLDAEIRRIGEDQIDKAIGSLKEPGDDPHEAIHDARKRLKKLRGLVRLVRSGDESVYDRLNATFRETARDLSGVRDKAALVEMIDKLQAAFDDEVATDAFVPVREKLVADRDAAMSAGKGEDDATIEAAVRALEDGRSVFADLRFGNGAHKPKRDARIVSAGLAKTFVRARTGLARASETRDAHDFHELRKRVKYHWMHLRLLSPLWRDGFAPSIDLAKEIADDLGDDHDVAVFRAELAREPGAYASEKQLSIVLALADRYQIQLREKSLASARILLAETGDAAGERIRKLYRLAAKRSARPDAMPAQNPEAERRSA